MKSLSINQMESFQGGKINWYDFGSGACFGIAVTSVFINPLVGYGIGLACGLIYT